MLKCPSMKISVVTPTWNRERFLPGLYDVWKSQTHTDRELLVYDDSAEPSAFFGKLVDARVRYQHSPTRVSVGEKRNRLCAMATGDVIAFFDDDDWYAPHYLATMVDALADCDLVKLAGWYAFYLPEDALFYWDTTRNHVVHHRVGDGPVGIALGEQFSPHFATRNADGFGFSYVFRRDSFGEARFPDQNFAEDYPFVTALRSSGKKVKHLQDETASVVHLVHGQSSSIAFPQYRLPPVAAKRLFPELAAHLARSK